MRPSILIVVSIVLGAGMGLGATILEFGPSPKGNIGLGVRAAQNNGNAPKAVVEADTFQFGTLELDARSSHNFTVRNEGKEPLEMTFDHVSCGLCTEAKPRQLTIAPGAETTLELTWHANKEGPFQQSATYNSNDPLKPQLAFSIAGRVLNKYAVEPAELALASVSVNDSRAADIKIYSYGSDAVEILKTELSDQETADKFEIATEPMSAAMLAEDPDAKSGLVVHVKLKPGLPLGPIRQKIKLQLSLAGEPVVEIPIYGNITSDVLLVGRGWDSERELLNLGVVNSKDGAKVTLLLQMYGENRREMNPQLESVSPDDVLKVTIGEKSESPDGRRVQASIGIEIPPGARQGTHLGGQEGKLGQVNIKLNDTEKLRVFIRFAVGG